MKKILNKNLLMLLLLVASVKLSAQTNPQNQVNVYFSSGVTRIVQTGDTAANVTAADVLALLAKYKLTSSAVYPSFPSFNEADTMMIVHDSMGAIDTFYQMDKAKVFEVTCLDTVTRDSLVNDLNTFPEVLFAEANGGVAPCGDPNDTYFAEQWGLKIPQALAMT